MKKSGVDAYYVPSTDPHQNEYVPACWQRRQWLSGFTGSAGDMLITRTMAGLWTDGRYFLQAGQEIQGSSIKLFKMGVKGVPTLSGWLEANMKKGQVLGADPQVLSRAVKAELEGALGRAGAKLKHVDGNLVDRVWTDQPAPSKAEIEILPSKYAGEAVSSKLRRIRQEMSKSRAGAHVLTTLDAIAWLFNIRCQDVEFNPVTIAYAVITPKQAVLFTDPDKVTEKVRTVLAPTVTIMPYTGMAAELTALAKSKTKIWVDGQTVNAWVLQKLKGCALHTAPSPIALLKAKKNAKEIAGMRASHRRDGLVMVRFLRWLSEEVSGGAVTERSAAAQLSAMRAEGDNFRGESFETIAGYGAHGAIIHYGATEESDATLAPEGIFLIDSGGQYLDGTTDITRTVLLGGKATPEQRDRYTRVLKGHIALARLRFPTGTAGRQIDAFARKALWDVGLNYQHGTGHGVGFYLNVHEGPQSISHARCVGVPLEAGNILSNEPGFYKEGEFGIRLENLVLVVKDEDVSSEEETFLGFETLTVCPFDRRLIDVALLTKGQRAWVDAYHRHVRATLSEQLEGKDVKWLKRATRPLRKGKKQQQKKKA